MNDMSHAYTVNIRDTSPDLLGDSVVRIDRANPVLGNPFPLRRRGDAQERARVIAQHAEHVQADIDRGGPISRAIESLANRVAEGETIALQCWCAPLPCHGDLYASLINERAKQLLRPTERPSS